MKFYKLNTFVILAAIAICNLSFTSVLAGGLTVEQGDSISLGSGQIRLDCGDLTVSGVLNMGTGRAHATGNVLVNVGGQLNVMQGSIEFGNDWNNNGNFNGGTGLVSLVDECGDGTSSFNDDNTFHNLTMNTSTGKVVALQAGQHQTVTNSLVLAGVLGNRLLLRSSVDGSITFLQLAGSGTQFINYVDVKDNWAKAPAQHLAFGQPDNFNSVDSGNNLRWFNNLGFNEGIPTLSQWGLLLLIAAVLMGAATLRRQYF